MPACFTWSIKKVQQKFQLQFQAQFSNCTFSSYKIIYKLVLVLSFYLSKDQKQESGFQRAGGLVKKFICICCLCRVVFCMKDVPKWIWILKSIFKKQLSPFFFTLFIFHDSCLRFMFHDSCSMINGLEVFVIEFKYRSAESIIIGFLPPRQERIIIYIMITCYCKLRILKFPVSYCNCM